MARLLIHVEGQTEESFVNEALREHLVNHGYESVSARIVGNARLRSSRGGIRPWPSVKKDIVNHLKEDPGCIATTLVDYYGLPRQGPSAWPGRQESAAATQESKGDLVEEAMRKDVAASMGRGRLRRDRFVPFVVVHEFEGLVFSDCKAFSKAIGWAEIAGELQAVRDQFLSPEHINDSPITAPSKRVKALVPKYVKPLFGVLAVLEIGLDKIRTECQHFDDWLTKLERLGRA